MANLVKSFRRQLDHCLTCKGLGSVGKGKKQRKCPECGGTGQAYVRPEKNGRIVVGGMMLGLFIIFCTAMLLTKVAKAETQIPQKPNSEEVLSTAVPTEPIQNQQKNQNGEPTQTETYCPLPYEVPGWDSTMWNRVRSWCQLIQDECIAKHDNLHYDLVAAVMVQESGGNPNLINPDSDATGLMQVMPRDGKGATYQCVNGPCFSSNPTQKELKDPTFNMQIGCNMLSHEIEDWGSIRDGLWAYYGTSSTYAEYADIVLGHYYLIKENELK